MRRGDMHRRGPPGPFGDNPPFDASHPAARQILDLISPLLQNSLSMEPPPPPPVSVGCGELRRDDEGKVVEMTGRIARKRMGKFAELRDRSGVTQIVIPDEEQDTRLSRRFANMPDDAVLTIIGTVLARPPSSQNRALSTGEIEVGVYDICRYEQPSLPPRSSGGQKRSYNTMTRASRFRGVTNTERKFVGDSENLVKYFENRDHTCNELNLDDVGMTVQLVGWMQNFNSSKFQQLKDGYGQIQIVVDEETKKTIMDKCDSKTLIQVNGKVVARPRNNINVRYETGEIEIVVDSLKAIDPDEPYTGQVKANEAPKPKESENGNEMSSKDKKMEIDTPKRVIHYNAYTNRTHNCGELTIDNVGQEVVVCGWMEYQRMLKFVVLRDGYGEVQAMIPEDLNVDLDSVPFESIIRIEGKVVARPDKTINAKLPTGMIEIYTKKFEVLNPSRASLPLQVRDFNRSRELLRMQHRYIDLRFRDMQKNLRLRSATIMKMREFLINRVGFVEVETPTLFRQTPGGAQEFLVPTQERGRFYSLVQSPQQFKQMLMAGAIDRYFQIARCYRDEATRPDRQPEFTQLDIELSFTSKEHIMKLIEDTLSFCWPNEIGEIITPFPHITYEEAMRCYGTDKPDTRFDMKLKEVTTILKKNKSLVSGEDFAAYAIKINKPQVVRVNSITTDLTKIAQDFTAKLVISKLTKKTVKDWADGMSKILTTDVAQQVATQLELEAGDLLLLGYGPKEDTQLLMGRIRLAYMGHLEVNDVVPRRRPCVFNFLWVTDFPMFNKIEETGELESVHHPFTAPHPDDIEKLANKNDLLSIRSQAYDLVLNGQEIGGGSMRIHDHDMQVQVLDEILKIDHTNLNHLLNALKFGCPPHGGIAIGLDRLLSIICNTKSIRDVIAFPKGLNGKDHLSKAPVPISNEELEIYHLNVVQGNEGDQEDRQDTEASGEEESEEENSNVMKGEKMEEDK